MDKFEVLKSCFGHTEFRGGQEAVVDAVLSGRDVLCVMPTGAGKSLCYQVPALILEGITLVISPLISLMKDQVAALVENGVRAAYLNTSLTPAQYAKALGNMRAGVYKIVYVAPERLFTEEFLSVCRSIRISLLAIDEAHCVSQWGQDFRPSYLHIADFVDRLGYRPTVGAFTATATPQVKGDIEGFLKLKRPFSITTGFDRPNLYFGVLNPKAKFEALAELLQTRRGATGIVYCATRKKVEDVCEKLNGLGYSATMYHAGLPDGVRRENQEDFIYDRKNIMVATNAFGMGIDKSNVSFVIHYNMPKNIESYYQEAGRAGRDGELADCILLYNAGDVRTNQFFIDNPDANSELTEEQQRQVRENDYRKLREMVFYSTATTCLRSFILDYFGEQSGESCGNCSNCQTEFENVDITTEAQMILSCIVRTGQRFGKRMICDTLRGGRNRKLAQFGLTGQSTFGLLKSYSEKQVLAMMDFLLREGYIAAREGDIPLLFVTEKGSDVLFGGKTLKMRMARPKKPVKKDFDHGLEDVSLLARLKELRREIADKKRVPAYIVFSDASLRDMCRLRPQNAAEFSAVSGVGRAKLEMYGESFLEIINEFCEAEETV